MLIRTFEKLRETSFESSILKSIKEHYSSHAWHSREDVKSLEFTLSFVSWLHIYSNMLSCQCIPTFLSAGCSRKGYRHSRNLPLVAIQTAQIQIQIISLPINPKYNSTQYTTPKYYKKTVLHKRNKLELKITKKKLYMIVFKID